MIPGEIITQPGDIELNMGRNTVKAWHFHHRQVDWWYVPIGLIHTVLVDNREESPAFGRKIEFLLGEVEADSPEMSLPGMAALVMSTAAVVRIPQGVLHGCRVLTDFAHLFYITSETYNPQDEGRLPFNSPDVSHSWGEEAELIVAANDRRLFIPPHPRTEIARTEMPEQKR